MVSSSLQTKLLDWYHRNYRQLPWRETKNAYAIWLSEIILQQTRVEQGRPYYERFIERYPSLQDLASAPEEEVLKLWEGLGYYSRARNMHAAAQMVRDQHGGDFPRTYPEIRALKGVGDYTAAAIASFAFDLAYAVVDGNVMRVLSRFFAEATEINTSKGKRLFQNLADEFLNQRDPAIHNQAMMELGATVCKPKNPLCGECPLQESCLAYKQANIHDYPQKRKKKYDRERFLNYLFLEHRGFTTVERREEGIWKGLYQFPLVETDRESTSSEMQAYWNSFPWFPHVESIEVHRLAKHKLSHQTLFISIWRIKITEEGPTDFGFKGKLVGIKDLKSLAFPKPLRLYLDEDQLTLPLD